MTFHQAKPERVPGAEDLAAASHPRGCTRPHSGEHGAGNPSSSCSSVRAEHGMCNLGGWPRAWASAPRRLCTPPPPPPSEAPPLPQRPARASLTCTANQSTASRAPEAAAELAPAGECSALFREAPRRERQKEESDGRRQRLGGRRRRKTSRARLQGVPPSSPLLCSSRRRSLPGLWGAGRSRRGRDFLSWTERRLSRAQAGEQWLEGRGLYRVHPLRMEGGLRCLAGVPTPSCLRPTRGSHLPGAWGWSRPRGGPRISASALRRPCLSSFRGSMGVLEGRRGDRRPPFCF